MRDAFFLLLLLRLGCFKCCDKCLPVTTKRIFPAKPIFPHIMDSNTCKTCLSITFCGDKRKKAYNVTFCILCEILGIPVEFGVPDEFTLKMFFPSLKVLEVMGALATTVFEVESS